jgi:hypothetical protein
MRWENRQVAITPMLGVAGQPDGSPHAGVVMCPPQGT